MMSVSVVSRYADSISTVRPAAGGPHGQIETLVALGEDQGVLAAGAPPCRQNLVRSVAGIGDDV